jgi:hypothetical protein
MLPHPRLTAAGHKDSNFRDLFARARSVYNGLGNSLGRWALDRRGPPQWRPYRRSNSANSLGARVGDFRQRTVILFRDVIGKFANGISNLCETLMIGRTAFGISLSQLQPLKSHLIIIGTKRALLQKFLCLFARLGRITGEHSLVKYLGRRERGAVAKHDVKKLQTFDMSPEDNKADRQRRRQNKAGRAPKRGPKVADAMTATGDSPVLCP